MDSARFRQIGILGTGRVAQALAVALVPHSAARPMMWGRKAEKLETAAAGAGRAVAEPRADRLIASCDVIAIAVSDDALASVIADLANMMSAGDAPFVFHVSGRSGAAILDPFRAKGALTAAIHPAMTFTGDPSSEVRRMASACFAITGSTPEAVEQARRFVALIGGDAVEIAEDHRALYHAALCHASNHLVTLIAGASDALRAVGVGDPAAMLAPLTHAALDNSLELGFAALSGPLLRGDEATIEGHLTALDAHCRALIPAYRAMALATLDELERSGTASVSPGLRSKLS